MKFALSFATAFAVAAATSTVSAAQIRMELKTVPNVPSATAIFDPVKNAQAAVWNEAPLRGAAAYSYLYDDSLKPVESRDVDMLPDGTTSIKKTGTATVTASGKWNSGDNSIVLTMNGGVQVLCTSTFRLLTDPHGCRLLNDQKKVLGDVRKLAVPAADGGLGNATAPTDDGRLNDYWAAMLFLMETKTIPF